MNLFMEPVVTRHAQARMLDALRGLYAVIGDGSVRTVGHRTRRLRRQ